MKVLFLDFDGVLNSTQSMHYWRRKKRIRNGYFHDESNLCPIACSNLRELCYVFPDLQIVISSTWRKLHTIDEIRTFLADNCDIKRANVIDYTPVIQTIGSVRGDEIQKWLDSNAEKLGVTKFVIVDDNSDMAHLLPFLVQTNEDNGLMWSDVENIMVRLRQ